MIGLLPEATNDIIDCINDFLFDKDKKAGDTPAYPCVLNGNFFLPAEINFFCVSWTAVSDQALITSKVSLGHLFNIKHEDTSRNCSSRKNLRVISKAC